MAGSLVGAAVPIGAYLWLNYVISGALLPGAARRRESLMVFIYESAKALVAEVNFVFVYVPHPRHPILLAAFAVVIVLTVAVSLQMTVRGRGAGRGLGRLDSGERVTIVAGGQEPGCPRTKKRIRDMPGYPGISRDIVGCAPGVSAQ